ncbi:hypothetical protein KO527_05340 [Pseudoalteromonas sp. C2R02]|uniref:hypothetical protein n=1 Tax=Pseudoalteromonas sp. C2R02 TaxID=2841565 RepID=UPI001C087EA0|nr:hypothetical protein [Pseudoalteromonas sp. C2R02]MBU2968772.1 hypothetical protein [Pseudoalteromonas sp. C2R02]
MSNKLSRLSDENIADPILRGVMYRKLLALKKDDWMDYVIKVDEEFRPDLVSHRIYGTPSCRWLVMLVAGNSDELDPLPVATKLLFPPANIIRQTIIQAGK